MAKRPRLWNQEYLGRLLGIAKGAKGSYHGVRKADFWTAWVHLAFETGSRAGEMFAIEANRFESDGGLKGKRLTDQAKAAVRILLGPRQYLFGRLAPKREILREFSVMQKKATMRQK